MKAWTWLAPRLMFGLALCAPVLADDIPTAERALELRNLLIQDCGSCHGLKMRGGLGPALLPEQLTSRSLEYLTTIILHGKPGSAMPAWRGLLTPTEARWIAQRLLEGPDS